MPQQDVVLVGNDGQSARLSRAAVANASIVLRDMLDDVPAGSNDIELNIPVVPGAILSHCAEYFSYRLGNSKTREIERPLRDKLINLVDEQDKARLLKWDEQTTIAVLKAASFLNAPDLMDLASAQVASLMMEKSIEEIRVMLGVENDFTPEEEAQLRKEHGLELQ